MMNFAVIFSNINKTTLKQFTDLHCTIEFKTKVDLFIHYLLNIHICNGKTVNNKISCHLYYFILIGMIRGFRHCFRLSLC